MESTLNEELVRLRQLMLSEEMVQSDGYKKLKETIDILKKKDKVLLLSCSNRYQFDPKKIDTPKSRLLALYIQEELGDKATYIDITELNILFICKMGTGKYVLPKLNGKTYMDSKQTYNFR